MARLNDSDEEGEIPVVQTNVHDVNSSITSPGEGVGHILLLLSVWSRIQKVCSHLCDVLVIDIIEIDSLPFVQAPMCARTHARTHTIRPLPRPNHKLLKSTCRHQPVFHEAEQ